MSTKGPYSKYWTILSTEQKSPNSDKFGHNKDGSN